MHTLLTFIAGPPHQNEPELYTYDQAALCWVAGVDPTGGMEYVTEKALAENDPYKQKDLAKALLQERANIKDFISQVRRHNTLAVFSPVCYSYHRV